MEQIVEKQKLCVYVYSDMCTHLKSGSQFGPGESNTALLLLNGYTQRTHHRCTIVSPI